MNFKSDAFQTTAPNRIPWDQITEAHVQAFYKVQLNAKFIWSATHVLYEKFWDLQDHETLNEKLIKTTIKHWMQKNTKIEKVPKHAKDAQAYTRFLVAFTMLSSDWTPTIF